MPKRDEDDLPKNPPPGRRERMPPPLGTDLIAKLQAAVEAAQRKRHQEPRREADADQNTDE